MEKETGNKKVVLLIATLSAFLTPFMGSSINIALPSIAREFFLDAVILSWIPTSYLLTAAIFLVPSGRLADIYGRKKIFTAGVIIYTLFSLLCSLSTSSLSLISFRILQGVGGAMIFGTGVAILVSIFPATERGKALGINVAAVYLGLSLGPFLGGFLTENFGWRSVFFINVPVGLIIISFVLWKFKGEWAEAEGESFDFLGALIYTAVLLAIMFGFSQLPKSTGMLFTLVGISGIFLFIWWEKKTPSPILNIHLFKNNPGFVFSNLAALINYSATFAVGFLLSLYLQYIKGKTPQNAGFILVFQPAVQSIFSPFAGKLSDRVEPRIVASSGMGLTVLGLFLLSFLKETTRIFPIILSLILLGFGFALFSSPNTNAVMSSVEKKFYGVASGTLATMRVIGQMFSMGIAMLVFAIFVGRTKITPEYYPVFLKSIKISFLIFAILCFFGIFFSLARGEVHNFTKNFQKKTV